MSLWASASASRTEKPSSRSIAATALLPLAMPPVNPSRNIFFNHRADAVDCDVETAGEARRRRDRKSTRLNSSHGYISYAVFCLKKKNPNVFVRDALSKHDAAAAASPRSPAVVARRDFLLPLIPHARSWHQRSLPLTHRNLQMPA